ncbi:hypothetical protein [Jannaschia pohangensis]|uniref:Uncharacterized protein n=1 Tax=Jannaschia pohangensis TaxID=390807 RepID=A0A1I3NN33_9RHOB|nr:hypothetical protein [Jannaschia pohangensis]SFJ10186.1 hypothetical protein SAMN04488095_2191 [Jannaschia pohangensis]
MNNRSGTGSFPGFKPRYREPSALLTSEERPASLPMAILTCAGMVMGGMAGFTGVTIAAFLMGWGWMPSIAAVLTALGLYTLNRAHGRRRPVVPRFVMALAFGLTLGAFASAFITWGWFFV